MSTLARIESGTIKYTTREEDSAHAHFMAREHTLPMLTQADPATSLFLYDRDDRLCYRPDTVLVDTGADLFICVSPHWARRCKLTVKQGSSQLVGVGGVGGAYGVSEQKIRVMLGSDGDAGAYSVGSLRGAFTMHLYPYIMTEQMQRDVRCEVIIGGAYLRACLGSIDYLSETLDISPAWLEHKLADLRVSIPIVCSRLRASRSKRALVIHRLPDQPQQGMHELLRRKYPSLASRPPVGSAEEPPAPAKGRSRSAPSSPADRARHQRRPRRHGSPPGSRSALALADRVIAAAADRRTMSPPRSSDPVVAAPLHPGFPQAPGTPTPAQYAQRRAQVAAQTALRDQARVAANYPAVTGGTTAARAEPSALQPTGVVYPVDQLRSTGRLREGFVVDLHPVVEQPVLTNAQLEHVIKTVTEQVLERLSGQVPRSYRDAVQSAVHQELLQRPAPARSAPPETLQARVHTPGPAVAPPAQPAAAGGQAVVRAGPPAGPAATSAPAALGVQPSSHPLSPGAHTAPVAPRHQSAAGSPAGPAITGTPAVPAERPRPSRAAAGAPPAPVADPSTSRRVPTSAPREGSSHAERSSRQRPAAPSRHGMTTRSRSPAQDLAAPAAGQEPSAKGYGPRPKTMRYGPVAIMRRSHPPVPRGWLASKHGNRLPLDMAARLLAAEPGRRVHVTAHKGSTC